MSQLISSPTRVTDSYETIIDHVYSNFPDYITSVSVPHYSISDHYPVCVTRKISNTFERGPVHKFISYRETRSFNESDFISELEEQPWTVINIFDTASDALDYFITNFNSVLNKHAPKKKRRVKKTKQPNRMNQNIMAARRTRDSIDKSKIWRNTVYGETNPPVLLKMPKRSSIPKVSTIIIETQNGSGKTYMTSPINQLSSKQTSFMMIMEILF